RSRPASSRTSAANPRACPPASRISAAADSTWSAALARSPTAQPSSASRPAIARPIPRPPPVTRAARLDSLIGCCAPAAELRREATSSARSGRLAPPSSRRYRTPAVLVRRPPHRGSFGALPVILNHLNLAVSDVQGAREFLVKY